MSENIPEGFSFKFGAGIGAKESASDKFLRTASSPTFPFLHCKVIPDDSVQEKQLEIKVSKEIYDFFKGAAQTDDVVFFLNNNTGTITQFSFDMVISIKLLAKLNIFVDINTWIIQSHESLTHLLKNEKVQPSFENKNALQNSKELLEAMEILDSVEKTSLIFSAVTETLKEKIMDAGTMIYRLAMAVFHSNIGVENPMLPEIIDPSSVYLKLIKSDVYSKWKSEFSEMMNLPLDLRVKTMRTFIPFTIASYAYFKTVNGDT